MPIVRIANGGACAFGCALATPAELQLVCGHEVHVACLEQTFDRNFLAGSGHVATCPGQRNGAECKDGINFNEFADAIQAAAGDGGGGAAGGDDGHGAADRDGAAAPGQGGGNGDGAAAAGGAAPGQGDGGAAGYPGGDAPVPAGDPVAPGGETGGSGESGEIGE